jgi:hypothetical protein
MPLWKLFKSYFSLGEWILSSVSAKPTSTVSMPRIERIDVTTGMPPPQPISADLPHSASSAARVAASGGLSLADADRRAAAADGELGEQSAGRRARTCASNAAQTWSGS